MVPLRESFPKILSFRSVKCHYKKVNISVKWKWQSGCLRKKVRDEHLHSLEQRAMQFDFEFARISASLMPTISGFFIDYLF